MSGPAQFARRPVLQSALAGALLGALSPFGARAADSDKLIVRSSEPLNSEPPLPALIAADTTPVDRFYVRNHGPIPNVDLSAHRLRLEGLVNRSAEWTLAALKDTFATESVEATLTCAGNRRQEQSAVKAVPGVQWDAGAIGHARWTGVKLVDLLAAAEVQAEAKHVWFEGLDPITEKDGSVAPFGGSIPIEKAMKTDVASLLAWAMNDQPLTAEHGAPLRSIVPGFIGARSVKWLTKITLSDRPSPNHYVAEAYKVIKTEDKGELAAASPIYGFPVNAAICAPTAKAQVAGRRVRVSGYALPGGEKSATVERVELSTNGGRSWTRATLNGAARPYSWQLWNAELELPPGKHELVVRATDSRGQGMPERGDWNLKGYLYNGWHRVPIEVTT